jgi:hypothetical protein
MAAKRVRITGDLYHQRVPEGAVKVTRPGRWGNPHPIGKPCKHCGDGTVHDRMEAIARYRDEVDAELVRRELRGRDLACWCRPEEPCHADVLLEIANRESA